MRGALRTILVLVFFLAAVGVGSAQEPAPPPSLPSLPDLEPGEGWQELLVAPRKDLVARAWSDPAAGCHLLSLLSPIPATAQVEPLAASFAKTLASKGLTMSNLQGEGESRRLSLASDNLVGIADLQLRRQSPTKGPSQALLVTCYWNQREPERSRATCERILARIPTTGVP